MGIKRHLAGKFILAGLLAASLGGSAAAVEWGRLNARGLPVSMDDIPLRSTGTGFYVSDAGHFVTAFHVAGNCARRAILRPGGAREAIVVTANPRSDLVVVKSAPPRAAAELAFGDDVAKSGALQIVRFRHMGGLRSGSIIEAYYLGRAQVPDRPQISFAVRAAKRVVGGNSGSPLIKSGGAVAGLVDAIAKADRTLVLIIDSRTIADALTQADVPFRWQDGPRRARLKAGAALQFTFPIACYQGS